MQPAGHMVRPVVKVRRGQGGLSHDFKLYKPQVNLDVRKYFFSRVIDIWKSLPVTVSLFHCNTIDTFKKKLTVS